MAYEVKEGNGTLFPNDKQGNQSSPDYTGNFKIGGKMWNIAGWVGKTKSGQSKMGLKISEPQAKGQSNNQQANDDLPF